MAKKGWEEQGESRLSSLNEWDCNRGDPLQQEKERTDRGQEQKQHRAQESCRRRAGEGGKGEAREVRIRRQMDFGVDEGWRVEPMLAMADGCVVRCARGASSRGSWSRGLTVETGRWWWWTLVVGARLGCGCGLSATPVTVPRTKRERGPCLTGSSMLFNPFPPPITSSVRLSQRRARAGQARRWLAAGQRHTWQRPGNQRQRQAGGCGFRDQLITKRGPVVEVEVEVEVPVPVGEVAEVC